MTLVSNQFLDIAIDYCGYIPQDDYLRMAVLEQQAVVSLYPSAKSSRGFIALAEAVLRWPVNDLPKGNVQFLWKRLLGGAEGGGEGAGDAAAD